MKTIKTTLRIVLLITVVNITAYSQGIKNIKIKTSAQTELCKTNIENVLKAEKGVKTASLDLKTKIVEVQYVENMTDYGKLSDAIVKIGYDADEKKADKEAYLKLPEQCKKPLQKKSECGSIQSGCGHKCGS
jgi:copper chaperone CopZ